MVRLLLFFFFMIRLPPSSTQIRSSAASDVYKRQDSFCGRLFSKFAGCFRDQNNRGVRRCQKPRIFSISAAGGYEDINKWEACFKLKSQITAARGGGLMNGVP